MISPSAVIKLSKKCLNKTDVMMPPVSISPWIAGKQEESYKKDLRITSQCGCWSIGLRGGGIRQGSGGVWCWNQSVREGLEHRVWEQVVI